MFHRISRPRFQDARTESIWLTIYADLITNLMMVFLALYGLTVMGDDAIAQALHSMKLSDINAPQMKLNKSDLSDVALILRKDLPMSMDFNIAEEAGTVRLQFGENILFASGEAQAKASAFSILQKVSALLKEVPFTVVIEGHTDSVPVGRGANYKDNRELSLARAMTIARFFIDQGHMNSNQLAAAAYGEYRPRASNETKAGRKMNRRVEIALVKDFPYGAKQTDESISVKEIIDVR